MSKVLYSLSALKELLVKEGASKVCVVTSQGLAKKLGWALGEISHTHVAYLPDGEVAKEWGEIEGLLKQFIKIGLDRKSIVIALGGGTIGDAAGFAASVYLRGIPFIQVPTTLVAQTDSAHGGKTGINFAGYKNQVGSFYPALATIVDVRFLRTLPEEQMIDGLGEIIKAGLIKDASILSILKKETVHTLANSPQLEALVKKAIAVKLYYVGKDFKEQNLRQMLNAGHTIGHAVELKYKLSHGKAVLVGLIKEQAIFESLGLAPASVRENLESLLAQMDMRLPAKLSPDMKSISHDKKLAGTMLMLPVVEKEGRSKLVPVELEIFKKYL